MLSSGANCRLALVTATATIGLMKGTMEFITMVIKSLLTIHFTFHTSVSHFARGKILKPTKIRWVVNFITAQCLLIKAKPLAIPRG